MERVRLSDRFLLLMLSLSFCYLRVGCTDDQFVGKLRERCIPEEREALLNFKQSLFDPQLALYDWNMSVDCCSWKGVGCSRTTDHVIKLDLSWEIVRFNRILRASSLVSSLFRLHHLQYLCLNGIYFNHTSIPHSISLLTKLRYLDLSSTGLIGVIPPHLGNLTNLQHLDLSTYSLTAPNLLWMSHLSSLKYLDMSFANLKLATNWFHEISILPALSTLFLDDCNLQTLPTLLSYSNFSSTIKVLDLGYNQFHSTIPSWLSNMTNLVGLYLNNCQLEGNITINTLGTLYRLKGLDLSNNSLDFNWISENWIPPFQVQYLYLGSCLIGPHFPQWLKTQKYISQLDLSNDGISDIIPTWFWNMFSQLTYLNISHNTIRGEVPMALNFTSSMAIIDLSSNQLEGCLPRLINVSVALFSNNKFSKGVEWYLNENTSYLNILLVSQNHLFGEIPKSICQMPSIYILDLSHNYLSGEIPKCPRNFSSFMRIEMIRLANNNFWGSIPQWIGNLTSLLYLHLDDNNFHGKIPFLGHCKNLITLDLGQNKLSGNIPLWIGENLLSLNILCLRSNKFNGSIPSNLSKLKELQILDLANNFLTGILSESFKNLSSMTILNKRPKLMNSSSDSYIIEIYSPDSLMLDIKGVEREYISILYLVILIDLSCNNLIGEIPIELMSLVGLISLNLSTNYFTGHIPFTIGAMQSLESLDLSRNQLSGEIPKSVANLSGLNHLNLSYNQLSGRIPVGTQLDGFDESSYYENLDLCGKPLLETCEGNQHAIRNGGSDSLADDDDYFGLFLGMGLGFAAGLWSVLGILLLKRSWAIACFRLVDNMINNIYVFVVVKVNLWFSL